MTIEPPYCLSPGFTYLLDSLVSIPEEAFTAVSSPQFLVNIFSHHVDHLHTLHRICRERDDGQQCSIYLLHQRQHSHPLIRVIIIVLEVTEQEEQLPHTQKIIQSIQLIM